MISTFTFKDLQDRHRVFILDLDGTLWNGSTPIHGTALAAYTLMIEKTNLVLFFTNGGYCSRHYTFTTIEKWLKKGLNPDQFAQIEHLVKIEYCYNTAQLTARFLEEFIPKHDENMKILTVGNAGLNQELYDHGFHGACLLKEETIGMTQAQYAEFQIDPQVKAIVKGSCGEFNFRKIAIASLYLQNPDILFVATNEDHTFICGPSLRRMPDVGATLRVLEASCGRKAFTVGKPGPYALKNILEDYFSDEKHLWEDPEFKSQFVYVGDNWETDIGFAKNAGISSCLVLTGMTKSIDEIATEIKPDYVLNSFNI